MTCWQGKAVAHIFVLGHHWTQREAPEHIWPKSVVVRTDPATIGTSLRRRRKRYLERVFCLVKIRYPTPDSLPRWDRRIDFSVLAICHRMRRGLLTVTDTDVEKCRLFDGHGLRSPREHSEISCVDSRRLARVAIEEHDTI
jgi:hypothetical protein